jgi:hypothetical protein
MTYIVLSPYIPTYPNVEIPSTKQSKLRVVEPSTRTSVSIDLLDKYKTYDTKGIKITTTQGSLIDFTI